MTKGTIVLTPFPFTDLSSVKRRPAVVVSSSSKPGDDVIVAFISSKLRPDISQTDFKLDKGHQDFYMTGLKRTSIFKIDKLLTVEKSIIAGE
ncbi:MAG: type II toxin-antitoxin system PemK/MazF family toxin [bacterium]